MRTDITIKEDGKILITFPKKLSYIELMKLESRFKPESLYTSNGGNIVFVLGSI
ncbi:MAG: hypothetical protein ACWGQW_01315 [bacterium]